MKVHRFIIPGCDLNSRHLRIEDGELVNQIRNVLKLKKGEMVVIADGKMSEADLRILELHKDYVEGEIGNVRKNKNELSRRLVLYCSLLKRENFELVVQKATEVGVSEIVPLIAERTVKLGLQRKRMEKIAKEAAEQSERGMVPEISDPVAFKEAVEKASKKGTVVFFDNKGGDVFSEELKKDPCIGIFIGPEGGWTEDEVGAARVNNARIISLSPFTFRAETAAIIASYIAGHFRG